MATEISFLSWIEELVPDGYIRKSMWGGIAFYLDGKLILMLFESPKIKTYKKITSKIDLWNGCMFPAERDQHPEILKIFPQLINHPVLGKWLYVPQQTEYFEDTVTAVLKYIRRRSPLFGVIPKPKKPKKITTKKTTKKISKTLNKPSLFADKLKSRKN